MSVFRCPGMEGLREALPREIACACGRTVEIWCDETEARCHGCGRTVMADLLPACVAWCAAARECVGEEVYQRYLRSRESPTNAGGMK
ncbi:MAG: phosphohydrolase [Candidatus Aureabacteria bacterium]|nr:phosphohydrolase [Candidatus Auribacterota bacterium]